MRFARWTILSATAVLASGVALSACGGGGGGGGKTIALLLPDLDAYISFDNERVGRLQATALENKLKQDGSAKGPIVMINGDPTDSNAHLFKQGASSVFSRDGVKIAKSYDTPDWERPHLTRHFGSANLN